MIADRRRGWCPSLSSPMETGDGFLIRLRPSSQTIDIEGFKAFCTAARVHGSGVVEITSRGSIQIRGLTAGSAAAFAAQVAPLAVDSGDGLSLLPHPLSGLDTGEHVDMLPLAAELRAALKTAPFTQRLAGKMSVVLDGADALHLDMLTADIRLRVAKFGKGLGFHVGLAGTAADAASLGGVLPEQAAACVLHLLRHLASEAPGARMRDMVRKGGLDTLRADLGDLLIDVATPPGRPAANWIGSHELKSGTKAIGLALPFGHSDAESLSALADAAVTAGAHGLRMAPGRVLLIVGLAPAKTAALRAAATALGFVTERDDPRLRVVACPGAPTCAAGEIPARALAPAVTKAVGASLSSDDIVHLSGCAKGCAHPAPARVTVIGRAGACDILADGRRKTAVAVADLPAALERLIAVAEVE